MEPGMMFREVEPLLSAVFIAFATVSVEGTESFGKTSLIVVTTDPDL